MEKQPKQAIKKKSATHPLKKLRKHSKEIVRNAESIKIPKEKLQSALELLNAPKTHPLWADRKHNTCAPYIHYSRNGLRSHTAASSLVETHILKYARDCLMRRDWLNLARVLASPGNVPTKLFPLYNKYAAIMLAHHGNRDLLNSYLNALRSERNADELLAACTTLRDEASTETTSETDNGSDWLCEDGSDWLYEDDSD